jgi:hypothetical protein
MLRDMVFSCCFKDLLLKGTSIIIQGFFHNCKVNEKLAGLSNSSKGGEQEEIFL